MLITLVSVEEHKHSLITKVTLTESLSVKTMNLRVCEDITYTLKVNNHEIAFSNLP